jgi:Zn finger protein HypA/HybF involved in hydrogenase expression
MKLLIAFIFLSFLVTNLFALEKEKANVTEKEIVMKHMPEANNCVLCHLSKNYKQFVLRDGSKIDLKNIDVLCGQCHGIKHRRWVDGRHGKVVTSWKVETRERLACIVCHDPHSPKIKPIQSKEPPKLRGYHQEHE